MSLKGVLSDFPVSDVFQLIAQQRKTGILQVDNDDRRLDVYFIEGDVLRARPGESRPDGALASFLMRTGVVSESDLARARRVQDDTLEPLPNILLTREVVAPGILEEISELTTQDTIFELFLWDEGRFEFRPEQVQATEFDQRINAERFLLDALRMRDEWAGVTRDLPDLGATLVKTIEYDEFRDCRESLAQRCGAKPEDLDKLFNLISGRLSARRVIDLSRLGTFGGGRALVEMLRAGAVRIETAAPKLSSRRLRGAPAKGSWLGYLSLTVCAGLAALLHLIPVPTRGDHPMPLPGFDATLATASADRIRLALEAHRWLKGEYPSRLSELEHSTSDLLAGISLDRYSYSRTGREYMLRKRHSRGQPAGTGRP